MTIRVFLADDHGVVREGLRLLLESQQDMAVVGESANGLDAVRDVLRLRPNVVVLDIAMPGLNGIEAARQIHIELPQCHAIMLSMHVSNEHIYRALEAGARGYVVKESAGEELIQAIRTVHAGERHLSPRISEELIADYLQQRSGAGDGDPMAELSVREREILPLVAEGHSSVEIGELLSLSPKTVETYRSRMMQKLGMSNVVELVKFAIRHDLVSLD
jgi:DNA-binding NarL/FixJ family response regulator